MMMFLGDQRLRRRTLSSSERLETKARKGDGEYVHLSEEAGKHESGDIDVCPERRSPR